MKWESINSNYSTMDNLLRGSTQMVNSLGSIVPINTSALNRQNKAIEETLPSSNSNSNLNNKSALNRAIELSNSDKLLNPNRRVGNYEFNPDQKAFYDELVNQGLTHNQSIAIMMNVQAENGWNPKYLYGDHQDVNRRAYGALSWQGGREKGLFDLLNKEGLLVDGKIVRDPKAMAVQARYFVNELRGAEKNNAREFLANGNMDEYTLSRLINKTVIRSSQSANILAQREKAYKSFGRR